MSFYFYQAGKHSIELDRDLFLFYLLIYSFIKEGTLNLLGVSLDQ